MNKNRIFIIIGIFWIAIIGGFIAYKEFTLQTGQEVLLKTRPVDPRDFFRGDYVILQYEISTIDTESLSLKGSDFNKEDKVYVTLDIDENKIGTISDIGKEIPSEGTSIEGTVRNIRGDNINVEYGIESYFVAENTGQEIENNLNNIYVEVAIDKFGNAVIKSLVSK